MRSIILRSRPSPALVVACLALLVALSGAGVAATLAVPRNSVGTVQLRSNAVISSKVKNGSLLRADFKSGQLPSGPAGPAGPAGAAGPSDAYARFLNGPVSIPTAPATIATLAIPQAGNYVIWSKAVISGGADCRLAAEGDTDDSSAADATTLSNLVVHVFSAAGTVSLQCSAAAATATNIKLAAIRTGTLVNSG
jgi:hypothetical protein